MQKEQQELANLIKGEVEIYGSSYYSFLFCW